MTMTEAPFPVPCSLPLASARCARVPPGDPGNPYNASAGEIFAK